MAEPIKNLETSTAYQRFKSIYEIMLHYCSKCKKNTESKNQKVSKTSKGKLMILSKYAMCNSKKPKLIKEQESSGLLSNLGLKTCLTKIQV